MSTTIRIALAQLDLTVGAVATNLRRIRGAVAEARAQGADLVVLPELALTGYPPEDLLLHGGLARQVDAALAALAAASAGIAIVVGHPQREGAALHNCASVLKDGARVATYRKQLLPNYRMFDEKRWFTPGATPCVVEVAGARIGITICEDLWWPGPAAQSAAAGAELIVNLSASPFEIGKPARRERVFAERAAESGRPIVTVNLVGGQDELMFDGASFALAADGKVALRLPECTGRVASVSFVRAADGALVPQPHALAPHLELEPSVYGALTLGIQDYASKNGFRGAVLGLSGGVDSALTLALAVDALGADAVAALMMPSRHTSELSLRGAERQAAALRVEYHSIPIEPANAALLEALAPLFALRPAGAGDVSEQNLQARCRGVLLMAASNRSGRLALTTGNKSELAVGYATLYGDMAGGYAPLRDVYKTLVWRLARWRNRDEEAIPREVIERAPTAELAPGQLDQDSLPPYPTLDAILEGFIEDDLAVDGIVARGHDRATVEQVVRMVQRAEFKRRQAAPGPMVSRRAFGRDRRYPVTSGYDPTAG